MFEYLLYIFFAILLIAILGIIIYSKGKNKGIPQINNFLEEKLDPVEHFKQISEDFGEEVNKDLIQNMNKKKKVINEKTIKRKIPEFYQAKQEHIDYLKNIGIDDEDLENLYEENENEFQGSNHKLLTLKNIDNSFLGFVKESIFDSVEIAIIPVDYISFEDENKIVLNNDLDLNPVSNGRIWIPNRFDSINTYMSVAYQDLYEGLAEIMKENMKHLMYSNLKTAESMEKISNIDNDNFKVGIAGDINKDG